MDKKKYDIYIHNGVLFSLKQNEMLSFTQMWMEPIIVLSEINQT